MSVLVDKYRRFRKGYPPKKYIPPTPTFKFCSPGVQHTVYVVGESLFRNLGYGGLSGAKFFILKGSIRRRIFLFSRSIRSEVEKFFHISRYRAGVAHCRRGSCGALCVCGFSLFHSCSVIIDTWKGGPRNPSVCSLVMSKLSFLTIPLIGVRYD